MTNMPKIHHRPNITPDRAMRLFWINGRPVPRTSSEIRERFAASSTVVNACLSGLVNAGMLQRDRHVNRDLGTIFEPTDKGAAYAKALVGGR